MHIKASLDSPSCLTGIGKFGTKQHAVLKIVKVFYLWIHAALRTAREPRAEFPLERVCLPNWHEAPFLDTTLGQHESPRDSRFASFSE